MLAGKPHPDTFPFEYIELGVRSPGTNDPNNGSITKLSIRDEELHTALQYGTTPGITELRDWIVNLTKKVHERDPSEGWRVSIGPGSQDLLYKAFNALLNPGDTVIVEGPTYPSVHSSNSLFQYMWGVLTMTRFSGATPIMDALSLNYVAVDVDENGIKTSVLADVLDNWDSSKPKPKAVYTIPVSARCPSMTGGCEFDH